MLNLEAEKIKDVRVSEMVEKLNKNLLNFIKIMI